MMDPRRRRIDSVYEMLQACDPVSKAPTRIASATSQHYPQVTRALDELVDAELVVDEAVPAGEVRKQGRIPIRRPGARSKDELQHQYTTTDKGKQFIALYDELNGLLAKTKKHEQLDKKIK